MINSLCGSLKSENNSRTKLQPISSNDQLVVQSSKKNATKSSGDLDTSLTPPSLNLSALKFELDGDVEVQSPDSTMWESFFADQLDADFMISSPVRNVLSPQASSYNCQYNSYGEGGQNIVSGCSQVTGACQKGKGLSPLHRVLNSSPNNNQYTHVENLSVPAIEELLEDYKGCSSSKDHIGSSSECFDLYNQIPPSMYTLPSSEMYEYEQQVGSMSQDSGLEMVHLLLACAEAVAKEEHMLARRYIQQLQLVVRPLGDSMQRVAACFTESLSARINSIPSPSPSPSNSLEVLKVYQIVYQACPYVKFAHFTANQAIFEAMENEERVHVIDLDILQGYQWPAFMQALAARPGGAPFLRITGVGPSLDHVRQTGRCLTDLAHSLRIPFEFHGLGQQLEDLTQSMLNRRVGEALAVNSVNRLHRVPGSHLGHLLSMIRDQAPNIVTLVEQEAGHNGPYFLGRFLEALHYYSAIFDSLDATFPPDSPQRAKVEQHIFAPEIMNIVACEGAQRFERHERLEKWRKIMEGKGFTGVPLSPNALTQSKILLGLYSSDGYRLTQDKGCLLLGWQDRPIVAASAWRC